MKITVLQNARIYTGVPERPWAAAAAIVDGRIAALDREARAWETAPGARCEDLAGALVLPGFTDAHVHFIWYALSRQEINLHGADRETFHARLRAAAQRTPPGEWISGRGWDQNLWSGGAFPTAAELDPLTPDHPVVLIAKSAHALVANGAALRRAGITATTPDPLYGKIGRDSQGEPNGLFFEESAMDLILRTIPDPTPEQLHALMLEAQSEFLAAGLTGIHDMDGATAFPAFQTLQNRGALHLRVTEYFRQASLDALLELGMQSGFGNSMLRCGGLKLFMDGSLGARTGAMLEPYEGEPENQGILTLEPEALESIARRAVAGGLPLTVHAIGDRANRLVLDILERTPAPVGRRHRIEHVQLIAPADLPRLAHAGIVASMQPIHAPHDMEMAERYWNARCSHAYAWRSLLEAGTVLAFGSDCPIESFHPLLGLYAAVTRRQEDGAPGVQGWHPEQRLTLEAAVQAYTWGPAYSVGQERSLGRLAPGYRADLVLLDRDIFALPPEALLETRVRRTMVDGDWKSGAAD